MRNALGLLWTEPRAPRPPERVWRDWALVALLVPTAVLEGILRDQVVWRPVAIGLCAGLAFTLLWRRTHPLAMVAAAFGAVIALDVVRLVAGAGSVGLYTTVFVIVLPYSLFRWGSGREAVLGLAIMLVAYTLGVAGDWTGAGDAVGASVVLLFPAVLGASVRYWTSSRQREVEQAKLQEREQLARELHDTVAHHVSAIAIRAQAGRVVSDSQPDAAQEALEVIEEQASRTLAEMRRMVGGLRDDEPPALAPQLGDDPIGNALRAAGEATTVVAELLPTGGKVNLSYGPEDVAEYVHQLAADHLVHGWDLAAATGGDRDLEEDLMRDLGEWFAEREELYRSAGLVGPRLDASGDLQTELLAAAGRDARWTPPKP